MADVGQEFAFGPAVGFGRILGSLQLIFHLLAFGDVDTRADVPEKRSVRQKARARLGVDPAKLPVVPAPAHLECEVGSFAYCSRRNLFVRLSIIFVYARLPAFTQLGFETCPGKLQPASIQVFAFSIGSRRPDHDRRTVGHGSKANFALAERFLGPGPLHELADLAADAGQDAQDFLIGR